jgi:hypothetical protein
MMDSPGSLGGHISPAAPNPAAFGYGRRKASIAGLIIAIATLLALGAAWLYWP